MKFLADTHALVWAISNSAKLSETAKRTFGEWELVVSAASLWELILKKGKPDALVDNPVAWWEAFVSKSNFTVLGIHQSHVIAIDRLPAIHRDPFDRILVAQAIVEKIPLVSRDKQLARYGIKVLW